LAKAVLLSRGLFAEISLQEQLGYPARRTGKLPVRETDQWSANHLK